MPSESRDYRRFLEDIVNSCALIIEWTSTIGRAELAADQKTFDAVIL